MLDFIGVQNSLATRGVVVDERQYLFVLQCVMGERPAIAYSLIYDPKGFKECVNTDDETEYLAEKNQEAELRLQQQDEQQLFTMLKEDYDSEIQTRALNLENYNFSTGQVIQILQNLLHNRASDIESSSVRDIISLINTLASQGALQTGDNFGSHFIQIYPKFDALCLCGREIDCVKGIDIVCPHCHQIYRWVEDEKRFYPQPMKL